MNKNCLVDYHLALAKRDGYKNVTRKALQKQTTGDLEASWCDVQHGKRSSLLGRIEAAARQKIAAEATSPPDFKQRAANDI